MRHVNINQPPFNLTQEQPGYSWRAAELGPAIGAVRMGATLYELPPGEATFPYHYEYGCEEWAIVLRGRPTLRHPNGEDVLEPGDVVCFPEGPEGAHKLTNNAPEVVRVILLSDKPTLAAAVYPDSGKIGIFPPGEEDTIMVRRESAVDYFDGEL